MRDREYHIQVAVVQWLRFNYPKVLFTTSPAGVKLPMPTAIKMKRMGYRSGTPDLLIFSPRGQFHGAFVELKTEDGRTSEAQEQFIKELDDNGYATKVAFGYDDAVQWLEKYFKLKENLWA